MGAGVAASGPDAQAIARRDPGCCLAEYLDQPVAPYTVDKPLEDGQLVRLGDADWEVVRTPGHTPGHLSLWQPEERLLVVGDALSDYDVGWVNCALDGPDAATTALASLQRLANLAPRVVLPSHGPIPADPGAAFASALRAGRQVASGGRQRRGPSVSRAVARSAPRRNAWVPCEWRRKCGETSASRPAARAARHPIPRVPGRHRKHPIVAQHVGGPQSLQLGPGRAREPG